MNRYFVADKDFTYGRIAFQKGDVLHCKYNGDINDTMEFIDYKNKVRLKIVYNSEITNLLREIKKGDKYVVLESCDTSNGAHVSNGDILTVFEIECRGETDLVLVDNERRYICEVGSGLFISRMERFDYEIPDESTHIGTIVEVSDEKMDYRFTRKFLKKININGVDMYLTIGQMYDENNIYDIMNFSSLSLHCRIKKGE